MSGLENKNYVGYERNQLLKNDTEMLISEVMENFLKFVKEYEPNLEEKMKIMIGDFLGDNNIPSMNVLAEDEILMLDRWNKSVLGE